MHGIVWLIYTLLYLVYSIEQYAVIVLIRQICVLFLKASLVFPGADVPLFIYPAFFGLTSRPLAPVESRLGLAELGFAPKEPRSNASLASFLRVSAAQWLCKPIEASKNTSLRNEKKSHQVKNLKGVIFIQVSTQNWQVLA